MSLLDQLNNATDGVQPASREGDTWRPAKERSHPEGIEGVIKEISLVPVREPREGGPTHDRVILVEAGDKVWRVYGSVRDLRDRFDALDSEGLLRPGNKIAIKFFGTRKEIANDGTPYQVHSYAVAAASANGQAASETVPF